VLPLNSHLNRTLRIPTCGRWYRWRQCHNTAVMVPSTPLHCIAVIRWW